MDGRVVEIGVPVLPPRHLHASLADLEDARVGAPAVPVERQVHAHEVGEGRARHGAREQVVLGHEEGRLVAAPRVPDKPDPLRVHQPGLQHCSHRRSERLHVGLSRPAVAVDDVRAEDEVSLVGPDLLVVVAGRIRHLVLVQALRQQLVVIDDHRVLLSRLVVRGIGQRSLQAPPPFVLVLDELGPSPGIVVLEGVGARDLAGVVEIRPGCEVVRGIVEALAAEDEDVGVPGLSQGAAKEAVGGVVPDQRLRVAPEPCA